MTGDALELRIEVGADGMARLMRLSAPGLAGPSPDAALPLLDVVIAGEGRAWSGGRYCESEAGYRFRYTGHDQRDNGAWRELRVDLDDPKTDIVKLTATFASLPDGANYVSNTDLVSESKHIEIKTSNSDYQKKGQ